MKRHILCFLLVLCFHFNNAQQAAYTLFAEEQFTGIQIYDVIQDDRLNYLFATNEGLYYYDYHKYEKIECTEAKSNSVFNLIRGKHGEIYCHNLNNQIFIIRNLKLDLLYELKEDESRSDINTIMNDEGELIICGKKLITINRSGEVIVRHHLKNRYYGSPSQLNDGSIILHGGNSDSVISLHKGKISSKKLFYTPINFLKEWLFTFFSIGKQSYALETKSKQLYFFNEKTFELKPCKFNQGFARGESVRIYEAKDHILVASSLSGINLIHDPINETSSKALYEDYYISDVYIDHEGNYLLSTFDKGVLVIPDLKIPDVINTFTNDPIVSLSTDTKYGLFLGSAKGNLLSYKNNEIKLIYYDNKKPIERIYNSEKCDFVIFNGSDINTFNKKTKNVVKLQKLALKDVEIVDKNLCYLGTNIGVFKFYPTIPGSFLESVDSLKFRIYSLAYDSIFKNLYASTMKGLYVLDSTGKVEKITYNNEDIFASTLSIVGNTLLVSSIKNGIFVIKEKKVQSTFNATVNSKTEHLKKIEAYRGNIIASSVNGLYLFDLTGKLLSSYHNTFGFQGRRAINFHLDGDTMWVSHAGGVQKIDLKYYASQNNVPELRIDKLLINGIQHDLTGNTNFSSNERKFQFSISSPTIRYSETIQFMYRLLGNDDEWQTVGINDNLITYNALEPGNYTFEIKAVNNNNFSKTLRYTFSIDKSIYNKWWFLVLIIAFSLIIIFLVYKYQLKIQKKKSDQINELNSSKLTAIQSQMNPHFIFNSLNSIQDLILKGDTEHSYSYIATFSNLVRKTLKYSEKDFIDFEQEVQLLDIYLSLEKLRFKNDFDFKINTNNIEDIMIPPLLLQPFVENSLVHGLLHKDGNKLVTINFILNGALTCIITDNGVGREKAKAIKVRQKSSHESFSGKAIKKRFEILSSVYAGNFGFEYEDLKESEVIIGTKVTLKIPVKHKF